MVLFSCFVVVVLMLLLMLTLMLFLLWCCVFDFVVIIFVAVIVIKDVFVAVYLVVDVEDCCHRELHNNQGGPLRMDRPAGTRNHPRRVCYVLSFLIFSYLF